MLPAYCAMMAITANIVPHLGDGPLWLQKTWGEAETCKKYWWTNLLFMSNFIDAKYEVRFIHLITYIFIYICTSSKFIVVKKKTM